MTELNKIVNKLTNIIISHHDHKTKPETYHTIAGLKELAKSNSTTFIDELTNLIDNATQTDSPEWSLLYCIRSVLFIIEPIINTSTVLNDSETTLVKTELKDLFFTLINLTQQPYQKILKTPHDVQLHGFICEDTDLDARNYCEIGNIIFNYFKEIFMLDDFNQDALEDYVSKLITDYQIEIEAKVKLTEEPQLKSTIESLRNELSKLKEEFTQLKTDYKHEVETNCTIELASIIDKTRIQRLQTAVDLKSIELEFLYTNNSSLKRTIGEQKIHYENQISLLKNSLMAFQKNQEHKQAPQDTPPFPSSHKEPFALSRTLSQGQKHSFLSSSRASALSREPFAVLIPDMASDESLAQRPKVDSDAVDNECKMM